MTSDNMRKTSHADKVPLYEVEEGVYIFLMWEINAFTSSAVESYTLYKINIIPKNTKTIH